MIFKFKITVKSINHIKNVQLHPLHKIIQFTIKWLVNIFICTIKKIAKHQGEKGPSAFLHKRLFTTPTCMQRVKKPGRTASLCWNLIRFSRISLFCNIILFLLSKRNIIETMSSGFHCVCQLISFSVYSLLAILRVQDETEKKRLEWDPKKI